MCSTRCESAMLSYLGTLAAKSSGSAHGGRRRQHWTYIFSSPRPARTTPASPRSIMRSTTSSTSSSAATCKRIPRREQKTARPARRLMARRQHQGHGRGSYLDTHIEDCQRSSLWLHPPGILNARCRLGTGDWVTFRFLSQPTAWQTRTTVVNVPVNNIIDNLTWTKGTHTIILRRQLAGHREQSRHRRKLILGRQHQPSTRLSGFPKAHPRIAGFRLSPNNFLR